MTWQVILENGQQKLLVISTGPDTWRGGFYDYLLYYASYRAANITHGEYGHCAYRPILYL